MDIVYIYFRDDKYPTQKYWNAHVEWRTTGIVTIVEGKDHASNAAQCVNVTHLPMDIVLRVNEVKE